MRARGMERANRFGWQNTYTFAKALGEMLIYRERGDLPVAVVRPSIVESALAQPAAGWLEVYAPSCDSIG